MDVAIHETGHSLDLLGASKVMESDYPERTFLELSVSTFL
jgi:hypothetical protein